MNIILPEIVSIGTADIAVKNKKVTARRTTVMFELELPIENGGTSYINAGNEPIRTDMVICAKPGQTRHTMLPFKCYYIHMIVARGELYDLLMELPDFIKTAQYATYYDIFKRICKTYDTALETDEIILQSLLLEFLYLVIHDSKKQRSRERVKPNNYEAIEKVVRYIKENPDADLSLEAMARYAGFSPVHFHNCFRVSTGKNLRAYVEEQRIKKAANLLVTTDRKLAEIAYECGFSSQSYFSYAFKRKMHLTPREYAKAMAARYEAAE